MRYFFIINPAAGGGRTCSLWPALAKRLRAANVAFEHVFSEAPGQATELARQGASAGFDGVVAVGGDGTVHEVVNGLVPGGAALGIVPLGPGNDLARTLGLPRPVEAAAQVLAAGRRRAVDLGIVNGRYYVQVSGVGFDAQVAAAVNRSGTRFRSAHLTYVAAILQQLVRYRNRPLRITLDGATRDLTSLLVAVGNAPFYAGGMLICPRARLDDGLLDACLVGDLRKWETLRLLPAVFKGGHLGNPRVAYVQARAVRVEGPPDLVIHADGQVIGGLPADFSVAAGALQVVVPERRP